MTASQTARSPYEAVYDPVRTELEEVVANVVTLAEQQGARSGAMAGQLNHVLGAPGKRLRPAITLLAARLWGGGREHDVKMATAVELLHIATLIHDDTVDSADTRRGQQTASHLWGRNVAVLLGDYVFAAAARYVCDTYDVRLVRRFAETIMELSRGELNELLEGRNPVVTRETYYQRIYDKTASLFTTAAESGGVLAGVPEPDIRKIRDYGYNLGIAYQVLDDVLDYESTSEEMGKPTGHDLKEGVLTLPAIMLIEREPESNAVLDLFAHATKTDDGDVTVDPAALTAAIDAVRSSGCLDESRAVAQRCIDEAREALSTMPESQERAALETLADLTGGRRS